MSEFDMRVREIGRRRLDRKIRQFIMWTAITIVAVFALQILNSNGMTQ